MSHYQEAYREPSFFTELHDILKMLKIKLQNLEVFVKSNSMLPF